jgi:hypothetical protein
MNLPACADELFPQDIASTLKSRLTFTEAIESPAMSLMRAVTVSLNCFLYGTAGRKDKFYPALPQS